MKHLSYPLLTKHIRKTFIKQLDQSDCGAACLLNITRYYGGDTDLESIRVQSGTLKSGTTLWGLAECAEKMGFKAFGAELTTEFLQTITQPCILHLTISENAHHYVVFYPQKDKKKQTFLIGNPASGITELSTNELERLWKSKAALIIEANPAEIKARHKPVKRWKWLSSEIRKQQDSIIVIAFTGMLAAVLGLVSTIFIQQLIDIFLPSENSFRLVSALIILMLTLLIRSGLVFLRQQVILRFSMEFNNNLFNRFLDHLFLLPKSWFDNRRTGELVMRMEDTQLIHKNITQLISAGTIDVLMTLSYLALILYYSVHIGLILIVYLPVLFFVGLHYTQKLYSLQQQSVSSQSRSAGFYTDSMQGIATIKSFGREHFFSGLSGNLFQSYQEHIRQFGQTASRFLLNYDLAGIVALCLGTALAVYLVVIHQISKGELVGIVALLSALIPAIGRLAEMQFRIQESKVACRRFFECMAAKSEDSPAASHRVPPFRSLAFKNVYFGFPGRKALLKRLNFSIQYGEITVIAGSNGIGKSSILHLIERFLHPSEGNLVLNDTHPLNSIPASLWRKNIAIVSQDIKLFNTTLLENISLGTETSSELMDHFCKLYGFDHYFSKLPNGYLTPLGAEGIQLSGGQKQLVCLARALFKRPTLLLLDEPTSAMDKETEKFAISLIEKLRPFMGIVWVTHYPFALNGPFKLVNLDTCRW